MEQVVTKQVTFAEVSQLAAQLSALDKLRLVGWLAPQIEEDLEAAQPAPAPKPRRSLRGIWKGVNITDEDIAEVRREMWANFPRDDF